MSLSMYQASVPVFVQFLTSMTVILDKAAAFAEAKKIDHSVILNERIYPDMFPFVRQVRAVTDHAISAGGRLAGVELPKFDNTEATLGDLKARVTTALDFLKGLTAAQIDGTEDKMLSIPMGPNIREFRGQNYLINFALPNFYFHHTTAYNILRRWGVEVGKRDFMGVYSMT